MSEQLGIRLSRPRKKRTRQALGFAALVAIGSASHATAAPEHPPTAALPQRPTSGPRILPSAHGDWRQWRGNPQHTGFQSLPGRIASPAVQWRYRLGGKVDQQRALLSSGLAGSADEGIVLSLPGELAAYTLDGVFLWQQRNGLDLTLMGCWDLWGDGRRQILAGSTGYSGGRLYLFDAADGSALWKSDPAPGNVGAVKILPSTSSKSRMLVWLPAADSTIRAFMFPEGSSSPAPLWSTELDNFISDPYTFSSLALARLPDGREGIVVGGARHQIPSITVDAATGKEISRTVFTFDGHAIESGGYGQLLALRDLDGSGRPQAINVASYGSNSTYMFQGISVNDPATPDAKLVFDSYPVGLHYVAGSVADFAGDGKIGILVSRYVPSAARHEMLLLDAATLTIRSRVPDFFLSAIVRGEAGQPTRFLGYSGVTTETPTGGESMIAYEYDGRSFRQSQFAPGMFQLATLPPRAYDVSTEDNPGVSAQLLDVNGDGLHEILGFRDVDRDGRLDLVAVSTVTGAAVVNYPIEHGVSMTVLGIYADAQVSKSRIVLGSNEGNLIFLDGNFRTVGEVPIGGYYKSDALNGHSFETAVVANLDGRGNSICVVDSLERVWKLGSTARATLLEPPDASLIWNGGISQEMVALPRADGRSNLLLRGWDAGNPSLSLVDADGTALWKHVFAGAAGNPREDTPAIGLNYGIFHDSPNPDVVLSMGGRGVLPRETCALDGSTGIKLWCSDVGSFWDATLAVWDIDRDGRDDVVLNFNTFKSLVVSGKTGRALGTPAEMPEYQDLEVVDYNGSPIIAGFNDEGAVEIVNAEDDAHLSLLTVHANSLDPNCCGTSNTWNQPQAAPDDQRFSMAALAPTGARDWIVGVGSQSGALEARRSSDGQTLWRIYLSRGGIVEQPQGNPLSSVITVDIDADGRPEFVVGGFDGWLYAVDARTGAVRWSLDLGAPLGDPIAADWNDDGYSELLVPAADGYLYAIGPAR